MKRGITVLNALVLVVVLVGSLLIINFIGGIFSEDITGGVVNLGDNNYRLSVKETVTIGGKSITLSDIDSKYAIYVSVAGIRGFAYLNDKVTVNGVDITLLKTNCYIGLRGMICNSADLKIVVAQAVPTAPTPTPVTTPTQVIRRLPTPPSTTAPSGPMVTQQVTQCNSFKTQKDARKTQITNQITALETEAVNLEGQYESMGCVAECTVNVDGSVTFAGVTNRDTCLGTTRFRDYICEGGVSKYEDKGCPAGKMCSDGNCVLDLCKDSDTDNNVGVGGSLSGENVKYLDTTRNVWIFSRSDSCVVGDVTKVIEWRCDQNYKPVYETLSCPSGTSCKESACAPFTQSCSDSDGAEANAYGIEGTVTYIDSVGNRRTYTDICKAGGILEEGKCSDVTFIKGSITCGAGCSGGKCL